MNHSGYHETAPHVPLGHPETMKSSQFHVGAASSRDELFEAEFESSEIYVGWRQR